MATPIDRSQEPSSKPKPFSYLLRPPPLPRRHPPPLSPFLLLEACHIKSPKSSKKKVLNALSNPCLPSETVSPPSKTLGIIFRVLGSRRWSVLVALLILGRRVTLSTPGSKSMMLILNTNVCLNQPWPNILPPLCTTFAWIEPLSFRRKIISLNGSLKRP